MANRPLVDMLMKLGAAGAAGAVLNGALPAMAQPSGAPARSAPTYRGPTGLKAQPGNVCIQVEQTDQGPQAFLIAIPGKTPEDKAIYSEIAGAAKVVKDSIVAQYAASFARMGDPKVPMPT